MNILEILKKAMDEGTSDIFMIPGLQITFKCHGEQKRQEGDKLAVEAINDLVEQIYEVSGRQRDNLEKGIDDDFSFSVRDLGRFRVNVFRQRGSLAAVIRVIRFGLPDPEKMGIPESVLSLAANKKGLVLITGRRNRKEHNSGLYDRQDKQHQGRPYNHYGRPYRVHPQA